VVLGGDGARWVKGGAEVLGARFILSRYHLREELCRALGRERDAIREVMAACDRGDLEAALSRVQHVGKGMRGEQARRLEHVSRYLVENESGLRDYRRDLGAEGKGLRRTGAIEGNVDKVVARRMKHQGMSWTMAGIRRMLCVRLMVLKGDLRRSLREPPALQAPHLPVRRARAVVHRATRTSPVSEWLEAALPALRGPQPNRPWVLCLRTLARAAR